MAEAKVSNVIVILLLLGVLAVLILGFSGVIAFGVINKGTWANLWAGAKGYTAATKPDEAMHFFHKAIQNRDYKIAGEKYCTKAYGELLIKGHERAKELGTDIDRVAEFGTNKAIMTDKALYLLTQLDPFPKNFKVGPTPTMDGEHKAKGTFIIEKLPYKKGEPNNIDWRDLDVEMYKNALVGTLFTGDHITLVKEGDEWKLDVKTNPQWDVLVNQFNAKAKTYHTGFEALIDYQTRGVYESPLAFENDILAKLRGAAKN